MQKIYVILLNRWIKIIIYVYQIKLELTINSLPIPLCGLHIPDGTHSRL